MDGFVERVRLGKVVTLENLILGSWGITDASDVAKSRRFIANLAGDFWESWVNFPYMGVANRALIVRLHRTRKRSGCFKDVIEADELPKSLDKASAHSIYALVAAITYPYIGNIGRGRINLNGIPRSPPSMAAEIYGQRAGDSENPNVAMVLCNDALKLAPSNYMPWLVRGVIRYMRKDYQGAIADFQKSFRRAMEEADKKETIWYLKSFRDEGLLYLGMATVEQKREDALRFYMQAMQANRSLTDTLIDVLRDKPYYGGNPQPKKGSGGNL